MSLILTSISGNGIVAIADRAMVYSDTDSQANDETKVVGDKARRLLINACGNISSDSLAFKDRIEKFLADHSTTDFRQLADELLAHMKEGDDGEERIVIQCAAIEERETLSIPVFFHISSANPAMKPGERYTRKKSGYGLSWDLDPVDSDAKRIRASRIIFCNGFAASRDLLLQTKIRASSLCSSIDQEATLLEGLFRDSAKETGTIDNGLIIVSTDPDVHKIQWS